MNTALSTTLLPVTVLLRSLTIFGNWGQIRTFSKKGKFALVTENNHLQSIINYDNRFCSVPAFFVAAKKNRRANAFIRNPKLDINMEIEPGMNVAWYLLTDIDHAIFDDKRFNINVIRQDKSLLDIGIECLDIPVNMRKKEIVESAPLYQISIFTLHNYPYFLNLDFN